MKRKLLLVALSALALACLFALSAFAAVDYSEKATLADGTVLPIYDSNNNQLIWYVSGVDADGNNIYSSVPNNRCEPNGNNDTYVTYESTTGTWAQLYDIFIHSYDEETGEYISTVDENLQIVVLNLRGLDMIYLGNVNVDHVQYMYYPATLKDCPEKFKGKTAIRLVDMSICNNLVGGFGGTQNFSGCTNLHTVRLPIGPNYTFEGKNNWKFKYTAISSIVIPEAVTSIGTDNFYGCQNLVSIYILGNETSLGQRNFENCANLTNIYILGDNPTIDLTSFKDNFVECEGKDFRSTGKYFFFVTTNTEYLNEVKEAIGGATLISYSNYKASPSSYTEGRYIIYGTNACDVYYGHTVNEETANSCAGVCERCGTAIVNHTEKENLTTTVKYQDGYMAAGTKTVVCNNPGCTYEKTEGVPALFTCLGYSAPENGNGGIVIGFSVNKVAVAEYENISKQTVSYGVFAVLKDTIGANDVFGKDGNASGGVVCADLTSYDFSVFELKIIGFADDQKDIKLAMGGYVAVTSENTTEYSYLQEGTPVNGEKYVFTSFNEIISK